MGYRYGYTLLLLLLLLLTPLSKQHPDLLLVLLIASYLISAGAVAEAPSLLISLCHVVPYRLVSGGHNRPSHQEDVKITFHTLKHPQARGLPDVFGVLSFTSTF